MPSLKYEPVTVKIEGFALSSLMDSKFLGELQKELPDAKIVAITLLSRKKDKSLEFASIMYKRSQDEKGEIVTLECDKPETLKKVINAVEGFKGKNNE